MQSAIADFYYYCICHYYLFLHIIYLNSRAGVYCLYEGQESLHGHQSKTLWFMTMCGQIPRPQCFLENLVVV